VSGVVEAVCVVHAVLDDPGGKPGRTAIDKRPVDGRRQVTAAGIDGDHVEAVEVHGGRDQAVYAYSAEDREWWAAELGRDLAPGAFGENLALRGVDVTGAVIGQTWRVGTALVQVTSPRIPCATFQRWLGEGQWVKRFTEAGVPGAYLRVLEPGEVSAGDSVEIVDTPAHGVTIGQAFAGRRGDRAALERLLAEGEDLQPSLVAGIERELAVGGDAPAASD
jgi:MOSC domain-containing protein YiiM